MAGNQHSNGIFAQDSENQLNARTRDFGRTVTTAYNKPENGKDWDTILEGMQEKLTKMTNQISSDAGKAFNDVIGKKFATTFNDTLVSIAANDKELKEAERRAQEEAWKKAIDTTTNPDERGKLEKQYHKQRLKWLQEEQEEARKEKDETWNSFKSNAKGLFTLNKEQFTKNLEGLKSALSEEGGLETVLSKATSALASFARSLEDAVEQIGSYTTAWDTRLHGSTLTNHSTLTALVKNAVGVSPWIKQSDVMAKLDDAIDQGINYNVAERAYLDTLSDSIATTFDAFSTTMNQIIRVQQADSTAERLGMEASMTEYLNATFQNTEYLSDEFDSVTSALYEATSLMASDESIGFEYQVQKWLGALYSVGMDGSSISSIATAIGQLASGDLSGTDSGAGKLLVMAASNAGLDYSKMISDGFDDSEINSLMQSMVDYLETIASDNKVVQTKMASIFGLKTSDVAAVTNLTDSTISNIYNTGSSYSAGSANSELLKMMGTIGLRTDMATAISNLKDNFIYTLEAGIAENPALYATYVLANTLQDATGGISIPAVSAAGFGVDLETTVAELMQVGVLGSSLLSGIGSMVNGLTQLGTGVLPSYLMFEALSSDTTKLGSGLSSSVGISNGNSELNTTYVGNSSGSDVISSVEATAQDNKVEAASSVDTEDEKTTTDLYDINSQLLDLLTEIVNGNQTLSVKLESSLLTSSSELDKTVYGG